MFINFNVGPIDYAEVTLKTAVPKTKDENWYPELKFFTVEGYETVCTIKSLTNELIQTLKKLEFSDLKYKLNNSLKQLEDETKNQNKYRAEIDDMTKSLLTQEQPEVTKKKLSLINYSAD